MKALIITLALLSAWLTPDRKVHDFAEVRPGDVVTDTIRFRNTGEEDLVIYNVNADCGCTTADYTKDPVSPGKEGYVVVRYKAPLNGRGRFRHSLRIRSNAGNAREIIFINGLLKNPDEKD